MLEAVRLALRITSTAFDSEITALIDACKIDLKIAGVVNINDNDPLIVRAVTLYSKANFGYADDGEKYQKSYDMLKTSLCLAGDYIKPIVQFDNLEISLACVAEGDFDV